jgi:hypothetical protein
MAALAAFKHRRGVLEDSQTTAAFRYGGLVLHNPSTGAESIKSVKNVTTTLAVLAHLAPFKHRCGFLEEGQTLPWPSSTANQRFN